MKARIIQLLKNVRDYIRYLLWILKGRLIPIDHVYKRQRVLFLAKQYGCETFVETGSFYGQMIEAVRTHFPVVLSIELSEPLYEHNRSRFARCGNVFLYSGDSGVLMSEMMAKISGRALFWLDGHYSGPGTARGATECPVMGELNGIQKHHRNDHCILIDDARCFDGANGYPEFSQVQKRLLEINPKYQIYVEHDCIIALPSMAD